MRVYKSSLNQDRYSAGMCDGILTMIGGAPFVYAVIESPGLGTLWQYYPGPAGTSVSAFIGDGAGSGVTEYKMEIFDGRYKGPVSFDFSCISGGTRTIHDIGPLGPVSQAVHYYVYQTLVFTVGETYTLKNIEKMLLMPLSGGIFAQENFSVTGTDGKVYSVDGEAVYIHNTKRSNGANNPAVDFMLNWEQLHIAQMSFTCSTTTKLFVRQKYRISDGNKRLPVLV